MRFFYLKFSEFLSEGLNYRKIKKKIFLVFEFIYHNNI